MKTYSLIVKKHLTLRAESDEDLVLLLKENKLFITDIDELVEWGEKGEEIRKELYLDSEATGRSREAVLRVREREA